MRLSSRLQYSAKDWDEDPEEELGRGRGRRQQKHGSFCGQCHLMMTCRGRTMPFANSAPVSPKDLGFSVDKRPTGSNSGISISQLRRWGYSRRRNYPVV